MANEAKCSTCTHALWDDRWGQYKCKKKQRVCTGSEVAMGCSEYGAPGVKPSEPKPEVVVRSGATFTPHVSDDGVLSWTNDKGLENPKSVSIKGKDGKAPVKGVDYFTEADKENMISKVIAALPVYDGEVEAI